MASTYFNTVKRYYDTGRYDNEAVAKFVKAGKLTPEEYKEITGEKYES